MPCSFGSKLTGISSDEVSHVEDLFGPQNVANKNHAHFGVYGFSYQLLGHIAAIATAGEPIGDTAYSADALLARHWISVLLVVVASAAVAAVALLLTGDKLISVWASAALLAVPVFLGHGMFNPKDIPVACGYTLVTLGCVMWLQRSRVPDVFRPWIFWMVV